GGPARREARRAGFMDLGYLSVLLFNGLVNGAFYALLSLGLAIIFGVMRVVNFAHGAFYMLGAFAAYLLLQQAGIPFWPALLIAPLAVGLGGAVCERLLLRRLYALDPLYSFLLTFGLTIFIQDAMRLRFGIQGQPYPLPGELASSVAAGFLGGRLASVGPSFDPPIEHVIVFALMAVILLVRPAGLFGSQEAA